MKKAFTALAAAALLALTLTGCNQEVTGTSSTPDSGNSSGASDAGSQTGELSGKLVFAGSSSMEGVMSKHGVSDEHIVTRVTGCPNGCGRAMLAEVGLVGKAPGRYNLHIGGNRNGTRIPRMYRENITESEILDSLDELVGRWAKEREAGEGFGDFTVRAGIIRPVLDPARDFWE